MNYFELLIYLPKPGFPVCTLHCVLVVTGLNKRIANKIKPLFELLPWSVHKTWKLPATMQEHKNYDTVFCGKPPLYRTNSIQPHGVLQWHPEEIATAEQFRNFLVAHTLNRLN